MVDVLTPHLLRRVAEPAKRLFVHPRALPLSLAPFALLCAKGYIIIGITYLVLAHVYLILRTYQNPYFVEELQARFAYRGQKRGDRGQKVSRYVC